MLCIVPGAPEIQEPKNRWMVRRGQALYVILKKDSTLSGGHSGRPLLTSSHCRPITSRYSSFNLNFAPLHFLVSGLKYLVCLICAAPHDIVCSSLTIGWLCARKSQLSRPLGSQSTTTPSRHRKTTREGCKLRSRTHSSTCDADMAPSHAVDTAATWFATGMILVLAAPPSSLLPM